jgi:hypothetical protein
MPLRGILRNVHTEHHRTVTEPNLDKPKKVLRFQDGDIFVAASTTKTLAPPSDIELDADFKNLLEQIHEACENLTHRALDNTTFEFSREDSTRRHLLRKIDSLGEGTTLSFVEKRKVERRQHILKAALSRQMIQAKLEALQSKMEEHQEDCSRRSAKHPDFEHLKTTMSFAVDGHTAPTYYRKLDESVSNAERFKFDCPAQLQWIDRVLEFAQQQALEHQQVYGHQIDLGTLKTRSQSLVLELKALQEKYAGLEPIKQSVPYHEALEALEPSAKAIESALAELQKKRLNLHDCVTIKGELNLLNIANLMEPIHELMLDYAGHVGMLWRASPNAHEAEKRYVSALEKKLSAQKDALHTQFNCMAHLTKYLLRKDLGIDLKPYDKLFAALPKIQLPIDALEFEVIRMLCVLHADIKDAVFRENKISVETTAKIKFLQAYITRLDPVLTNMPKLNTPEVRKCLERARQTGRMQFVASHKK